MPRKKKLEQLWIVRYFAVVLLLGQTLLHFLQGKTYYRKILQHMVTAGPASVSPVLLVSGFAGMIFTIQTARELIKFGAVSAVGGAFGLAFCRELAPLLTASIIAGQVGSAFAAEIGAMGVTEQIDALYMLKTNPIDYLVLPRVIACILMMPIMMVFALVLGIMGGVFAAAQFYHIQPEAFLESVRSLLKLSDLFMVLVKGIIFGAIVAINGCSWGLTTKGGAKEVGESATTAVVTTWVLIFIMDFFLSLLMFE
ncbi:MlaE family lipid ABC transporter permease subunit [Chrysosporum ovalisporum Ak1311]|uniref:MlaE family lipid ABC transporter permease subunit n=2 Tax=Umezakia ovalisporum TaxID=75695 RepID=A0AA43GZV8_9CYAN|nr:MlaE family lipid ABC transporter permease subunit [Umezakia ovalisporum]MBI1242539.1 MlaE family lipid ABC transporter permease subunit [Nostoc sp. RI_552]MDH6057384.1 MlaE family lipid ABC transporter permease subunit [Umezakia ovalisporum FSS-43]MDH6064561.1 MlaE family lipid ABC transporter permease subunit [Umezakia ovalisporum FSS-62]MDH6065896.1 MlaE family lipid ABC transporter permease subunit [Umezakia ovalisporum APH033B]MDH6070774.1 MlaE family lipid ABC transporter permease sub